MQARTNWLPAQGEPTVTKLLRHGQTVMSVQKRYSGRTDVPLTDLGVRQAAAAARRLAPAGIALIVTSPLLRAARTAEEIAAVTGSPVEAEEGFRETDFGAWEGLTFADAAYQNDEPSRILSVVMIIIQACGRCRTDGTSKEHAVLRNVLRIVVVKEETRLKCRRGNVLNVDDRRAGLIEILSVPGDLHRDDDLRAFAG